MAIRQKRTSALIFAILAALLAILPFPVTFNETLTHLIEKLRLYTWVQVPVVPAVEEELILESILYPARPILPRTAKT